MLYYRPLSAPSVATRVEGGPAVSLYVMLSTLSESGRKVLRLEGGAGRRQGKKKRA